ncbi:hypothetical protein K432DRAFT_380982 [Lepidopterella palustris CBS 459.81]|uniref:Wax synthase domain-containing protein n=1 Tax=Lepidopterella palustris CBS 459.81 TaxID=1314670 RepID=A0A8E2ED04_9PEZI|nr:hypothetical protein K432DRAFT_380982 [Lepidopterella palustris CBS 459.81]
MKLLQSFPATHHELLKHYYAQYDAGIQSGKYEPFVYPWGIFGAALAVVYLLIPHQTSPLLRRARFLAFAWIACFAAYTIKYCRARNMTSAFGIGIISAWSVIWLATILVVNDAQTDFQRIERLEGVTGKSTDPGPNGTLQEVGKGEIDTHKAVRTAPKGPGHLGPGQRHGPFAWQPYPLSPFIERLDWVLDILCNFRGMGWNWQISGLPPPPKWIQEQLRENSGSELSKRDPRVGLDGTSVYQTRSELLWANIKTLVTGYLFLDFLKVVMNHDPYFWGIMDRPPPSYLPSIIANYPILLRLYRLAVSQYVIKWSLQTLFCMLPLFVVGILGPSIIGARAEPWMHPDTWGSYSNVLDRGLAGWWSGWWHQTFRFAFEEPSRKLIAMTGINPRSITAKLLQLFIAFLLSGFVHACSSYTQPGYTYPIRGPFLYFTLQAFGITAEVFLTKAVDWTGIQKHVPKAVRRFFTFVYVHVWFYHTSPLLCDDFARGGLWMYEPVPISPLRALGFGVDGDSWWCWGGQWVYLHRGNRWWKSGVAF